MKTFTFYAQKRHTVLEECPYSVNADSIEEARKIFLKALKEGEEDKYSDDNWYSLDNTIGDDLSYWDENNEEIIW